MWLLPMLIVWPKNLKVKDFIIQHLSQKGTIYQQLLQIFLWIKKHIMLEPFNKFKYSKQGADGGLTK